MTCSITSSSGMKNGWPWRELRSGGWWTRCRWVHAERFIRLFMHSLKLGICSRAVKWRLITALIWIFMQEPSAPLVILTHIGAQTDNSPSCETNMFNISRQNPICSWPYIIVHWYDNDFVFFHIVPYLNTLSVLSKPKNNHNIANLFFNVTFRGISDNSLENVMRKWISERQKYLHTLSKK